MRHLVPVALVAALLGHPVLAVEHWAPDGDECNQKVSTMEIVDCLNERTKIWDARLNQAWKALTTMLRDPASKNQLAALRTAEQAWIKFRDANCGYYAAQEGTIRLVAGAMCMRDMTQARAIELQGEGPQ